MTLSFSKPLLSSAVATLAAFSGFAEEIPDETDRKKLPSTVVTARHAAAAPGSSPTSPSNDEASVSPKHSTGAVNFITAGDYGKGRASTLRDMLDFQPGIFIQTRTGQEEARLSIRGSGIQRTYHGRGVLMTQDGLPLNLADGSFDMQNLDPAAYSRILVRRGASATSRGSGTLGGAIDFVSFTGRDAPVARLSAEGGSSGYGRVSGTASSSGRHPDTGDVVATATFAHSDGWRDASESESQRANVNAGVLLAQNTENRLYLAYTKTETALPGSLTKAQLEANPRQAAPGNITNPNARDYEWFRIADRVVSDFDDARLELAAGWQHKNLDHPIYQTLNDWSDDFVALAKIDYTADLDGRKNRITLGVMPTFGFLDDRRFVNPPGPARLGAPLSTSTQNAGNVAAFAEEEHHFTKDFAGVAGVRFDYARRDYEVDREGGGVVFADSRAKDYLGVSPTLGLRHDFDDATWQVFANVSRSFEAPTFGEFAQSRASVPDGVEAQTATTFEVGTRGARGAFAWDIAHYQAFVENEFISSTEFPGGPTATFNAAETRHQGVEAGLDANLLGGDITAKDTQRLLLRQVLGWNDFRFDNDPNFGDNRIAGIPEGTYRAELRYEHPCGFYAGVNVECALTKSWVDHANTTCADPYATLGFRTGYKKGRGFGCHFEARNLLNTTYAATTGVVNRVTAANAAQFNPGDGFAVYAGIGYTW